MDLRGRKLKFTAVTAMVVLALTGFSSGRGHGSGGDGDSGGGCSSSSQNHDSSSGSRHDDDDIDTDNDTGSGSGDAGSLAEEATVQLVSCASAETPYAVVEVTNPNSTADDVTVVVTFLDAQDSVVDMQTVDQSVPANDTVEVQVDLTSTAAAADISRCEAELMPKV
ncbi:putative secreted protein [Streptomyces davaonensis JCM 4913]|uniref:Putative secreted protein n=1 Tax=Streptomyces davaonensis (strain DSM 101723 / JCM 4913 / KCC S-0913 / 768) TaxID=1214101 RepID=K4R8E4_STRDJ|nr:hypothetical protein [Streptomyces davaonensis]CCK29387.1 putative secreted protein [Streptomyces davaonensis JCM 4913]